MAGDGEPATSNRHLGERFKDVSDDFGERGAALGSPDASGAMSLAGDCDGDVFHAIQLHFYSGLVARLLSVRPCVTTRWRRKGRRTEFAWMSTFPHCAPKGGNYRQTWGEKVKK
jgi:hypothetical protein